MRILLLMLFALASVTRAGPVTVEAVADAQRGAPDSGEWPVVFRGGPTLTRLGPGRVRWGSPPRAIFFAPTSAGKHRRVRSREVPSGIETTLATIPAPSGGEARVYLSDRDDLAAFTVDFETWDTCPEIRALRPDGVEEIDLPCPEAGRAAMKALQDGGHMPSDQDSRARMRFRLANLRYVQPGFLAAGGVELDAELRVTSWSKDPQLFRARFILREGRIQACTLLD